MAFKGEDRSYSNKEVFFEDLGGGAKDRRGKNEEKIEGKLGTEMEAEDPEDGLMPNEQITHLLPKSQGMKG